MRYRRLRHPLCPNEVENQENTSLSGGDENFNFEGIRIQALETGRNRLLVTGALFTLAFLFIAVRLIELALTDKVSEISRHDRVAALPEIQKSRSDIIDRNGILLATSLPTASLYANPRQVLDPNEVAHNLARVFPRINKHKVEEKLSTDKSFVWLERNLTPKAQFLINTMGIPGLYFQRTERRVYPHGREASHIIGLTNIDGEGLSGVEGYFDKQLREFGDPFALSIDIRVQSILREELKKSILEFNAIGATGIVIDATNGEVRAMVSLPDFDPNKPVTAAGVAGFNRATKGVYEMGSTFKLFTVAMALDSGVTNLRDKYDASKPIKISRFRIKDYHPKNRWLSVPEIIIYSSNIGAAKMALDLGTTDQKKYLKLFGMLSPARIDLPEIGHPLTPDHWREINTMTISYGHGIAVSPIQLVSGISALVNGGILYRPSIARIPQGLKPQGSRVLSSNTSKKMRTLMRLVVRHGTGKNADVPGYLIGGKTGTADKPSPGGGYGTRRIISSFVAAFPINKPRYVLLALLDEPKGNRRTSFYATGGWVAAPIISKVVKRMAPLLGLKPNIGEEKILEINGKSSAIGRIIQN